MPRPIFIYILRPGLINCSWSELIVERFALDHPGHGLQADVRRRREEGRIGLARVDDSGPKWSRKHQGAYRRRSWRGSARRTTRPPPRSAEGLAGCSMRKLTPHRAGTRARRLKASDHSSLSPSLRGGDDGMDVRRLVHRTSGCPPGRRRNTVNHGPLSRPGFTWKAGRHARTIDISRDHGCRGCPDPGSDALEVSRRDFWRAPPAVFGGGAPRRSRRDSGRIWHPRWPGRPSFKSRPRSPCTGRLGLAFLGGLIRFGINHDRWNTDGFLRDFVVNSTSRRC